MSDKSEKLIILGKSGSGKDFLVRKLVEKGVRFVQLFDWGWDSHGTDPGTALDQGFIDKCRENDQAVSALLMDLKQRGILDETLVVWGGEFGRTNYSQGTLTKDNYGRDHHPRCFTFWLAGGGIKPGVLIHATRVAVTGQGNSPGIFEVLELIGRDRVVTRLRTIAADLS